MAAPTGLRWLDVGCGTGALSRLIADSAEPAHVVAIDFASGFITHAQRLHAATAIDFGVASANDLPFTDAQFDHIVSGLALNFFPDPAAAVREMRRVAADNAIIAVYVWDYAGEMQMLRRFWDAVVALNPTATQHDEGVRFPLCQPELLNDLFTAAGLSAVTIVALDVPARFADWDDFWQPFLGQTGPAPSYVASLSAEKQAVLAATLRTALPIAPDGTITLPMRAWAVRGGVP